MSTKYILDGMLLHFMVVGTILTLIFFILYRRHLFFWLSAGFWAWTVFALYFFIAPLIQYWGDPIYLESRISVTEGWPRMVWVTFFVAAGIVMFFWGYLRSRPGTPRFGLKQQIWPTGTWVVILLSLLAAGYALITYRGAFGFEAKPFEVVGSKHVGDVTGYETVLYILANFPLVLLVMRRGTRILGLVLMGLYLVGRLQDRYDRNSAVSLLLAIVMVMTLIRRRKWPTPLWIVPLLVFTLLLQARGHSTFSQFRESGRMTLETSREEVERGEGVTMQASLYVKSYLHDKVGYTYGIPLISAVLFGPLPRKYFPWKDWMMEGRFKELFRTFELEPMMFGSKSSVIGDLYGFGGVFAVAGGMWLLGFLTRKLDGFLAPQAPMAVRAIGVVWLSSLWMMLGSALLWSAAGLYLNAVPFVGVVLCGKIFGGGERRSMSEPKYWLKS